ncbi:Hypothetical predicted protein [Mytilus galloprovincialis]|uniref:WAP domain-containing protein n=1 Tax=Mytilus galloprovincialis TaxID=29158 RepID=A0A8B6EBY6_MYTGA|nr:Hypothetical predicted protein [Mytilus galloprovincialis]
MKLFTVLVFLAVLSISDAFLSDLLRLKAVSALLGGNRGGGSGNAGGGNNFAKLLWCKKTPSEFRFPCSNSQQCNLGVQLECVSGRCCATNYGTLTIIDK